MKIPPTKPTQFGSIAMNGQEYAWDSAQGLDPAVTLEVQGFVRKKAGAYVERGRLAGVAYEDLVQEGMTAALKAAGKFRPDGGASYLTYAGFWIDFAMKEVLKRPLVRTPDGEPFAQVWSLDAPLGTEGDENAPVLLDWQRADLPDAHDLSLAEEDQVRVRRALAKLDPKDREVLVRHRGLQGRKEQSLQAVARDMGLTRQQAGQALDRACADLRLYLGGRAA